MLFLWDWEESIGLIGQDYKKIPQELELCLTFGVDLH